jgi:hypothetical protein
METTEKLVLKMAGKRTIHQADCSTIPKGLVGSMDYPYTQAANAEFFHCCKRCLPNGVK